MSSTPVTISFDELKAGVEDSILLDAFGQNSLGVIFVSGLPSNFLELRKRVLLSASYLSRLPKQELERLESPDGHWLTGWSLGKEKLNDSDEPDMSKGSYYVNCSFCVDENLEGPPMEEVQKFEKFKAYTTWNKWPDEEKFSTLVNFQSDLKELIKMMVGVAKVVALSCDKFCHNRLDNYEQGFLERIVSTSTTTKARLLHYYPLTDETSGSEWCGEHLDHSCLTALTSALFLDETNPDAIEILQENPDPGSGLYIKDRKGNDVKANIPSDVIAFQTGSALAEVSKNQFEAVPHYVKSSPLRNIARNTLAVFCQPSLHEMVNDHETFAEYAERILVSNH